MTKKYAPPTANEIENYLTQHGFHCKNQAGHLKLDVAPCCGHKKSFSINESTGQWICYFAECGKKGNWVTLRRDILHDPLPEDKAFKQSFNTDLQKFFAETNRGPVTRNKYPEVLDYLHKRGFSNDTLDAFRVTNKNADSVRFPMYTWHDGKWEIVNSRIILVIGEKRNYFEPSGAPTHLLIGNHLLEDSKDKIVYVFEGQWDVLTAFELGLRNVFSLPNGASSVKPEMFEYIPLDWEICICVDMDESGKKCAQKFYDLFSNRVSRIHLPHKDLNDWFKADPNLTKEMVLECKSYKVLLKEKNYRKIRRNISEDAKQKPLMETPFKSLDDLMGGGWFPTQMTSILAASGAGKTTLVNQIAVYTAHRGIKVGLISLEGSEQELDEKLDRTINGVCGEQSDKDVLENLMVSSLKGKYVSHAQILEECNVMALEDRCKLLIVDNLDYITSGIDQKKYETTAALMALCDKSKIHLIQMWQCNKADPTKRVNSYSQKGESRIFQDSHNYINMNSRDPDGKELEVEKNREKGRGKYLVNLDYDEKTNCYVEVIPDKNHKLKLLDLQS